MQVNLEPMTEQLFQSYYQRSIKSYAAEHVRAGNWAERESIEKAQSAFKQLLPEGLATKNQHLFSVVYHDQFIGVLWFHIREKAGEKEAFIYDIELDENCRGKGLGKCTMQALDIYAKSMGIRQIALHVFAHNHRAKTLYEKMGYEITDMMMKKVL